MALKADGRIGAVSADQPIDATRTFDEFCEVVAVAIGRTPSQVREAGLIVADLKLDVCSVASLVVAVTDLNRYFELPEQMDVDDLTMADLYHFYRVMDAGHVEADTG